MSGLRRSARVSTKLQSVEKKEAAEEEEAESKETTEGKRRKQRHPSGGRSNSTSVDFVDVAPVKSLRQSKKAKSDSVTTRTETSSGLIAARHALEAARETHDLIATERLLTTLQKEPCERSEDLVTEAKEIVRYLKEERDRLRVMTKYEKHILTDERKRLIKQGCTDVRGEMKTFAIIGVDEVGVGPLAGPCVSGAVVLHMALDDEDEGASLEWQFGLRTYYGLNDSKKIKPLQRERLAKQLKDDQAHGKIHSALGICTSQEVDMLNPRAASMEAMRRAVVQLLEGPLNGFRVHLLVDYHTVPDMPSQVTGQTCLTKGDAKSQSIAAASVLAKVYRDAYMSRLHDEYPHFGFDRNVGYGTRDHMDALRRGLLCPEHRLSFAPVRAAHALLHPAEAEEGGNEEQVKADDLVGGRGRKAKASAKGRTTKSSTKKVAAASPLQTVLEPNNAGAGTDGIFLDGQQGHGSSLTLAIPKLTGLTKWLGYSAA